MCRGGNCTGGFGGCVRYKFACVIKGGHDGSRINRKMQFAGVEGDYYCCAALIKRCM